MHLYTLSASLLLLLHHNLAARQEHNLYMHSLTTVLQDNLYTLLLHHNLAATQKHNLYTLSASLLYNNTTSTHYQPHYYYMNLTAILQHNLDMLSLNTTLEHMHFKRLTDYFLLI